jgi:hypothetical protein
MYFKITVTQRMGDVYDSGYFSAIKEKMINSSWSEVRNGSIIKLELMVPNSESITEKIREWQRAWDIISGTFSFSISREDMSKMYDARPECMTDSIILHEDKLSDIFESDEKYSCGVYYGKIEKGISKFRFYYSKIPHIKFEIKSPSKTHLVPSYFESDAVPEDIQALNELLEIKYNEW